MLLLRRTFNVSLDVFLCRIASSDNQDGHYIPSRDHHRDLSQIIFANPNLLR